MVLGHEGAGVVEAVGERVTTVAPGASGSAPGAGAVRILAVSATTNEVPMRFLMLFPPNDFY